MKESQYRVINSSLHSKETPSCLLNMEVHYLVHKSLLPAHILSQINPVQAIPSYFLRTILILSSHLFLCLPSCLFPTSLPIKTISLLHHMCHMQFSYPSLIPPPPGTNIFLSTLFSHILSPYSSLNVIDQLHIHRK